MKLPGGVIVGGSKVKLDRYRYASCFTKGKSVLDVGCGCGWGLLQIADKVATAWAIDLYDEPLQIASERFKNIPHIKVKKANAEKLPFKDKTFHISICFEVIEHLEDPEACLREIERVTHETALFSTPSKRYWGNPVGARARYHKKHFEKEELHSLLAKHYKEVTFVPSSESRVHSGTLLFRCVT